MEINLQGRTEIRAGEFADNKRIEEVRIPSSVHTIGSRAFVNCENLRTVIIENPGVFVGEYAFNGTAYYNNAQANADNYRRGAAGRGSSDLVLPEGVTNVDIWEFSKASIKTLYLPNSIRTIGMCAFKDCTALEKVSMSPNTCCRFRDDLINDGVFAGCTSLKEVTFRGPVHHKEMNGSDAAGFLRGFDPERTFRNCTSLKKMTAYHIMPDVFPDSWRSYAINGYLADAERKEHFLPEVAAAYDKILEKRRRMLIRKTKVDHSYALHQYLIEHEMINEDEIEEVFSNAQKVGSTEVIAALLSYKRRFGDADDIFSELSDI